MPCVDGAEDAPLCINGATSSNFTGWVDGNQHMHDADLITGKWDCTPTSGAPQHCARDIIDGLE
jgi:hypothetical protein